MNTTTEQVNADISCEEEKQEIIKVRVMGTEEDINWFKNIFMNIPGIDVFDHSDIFPCIGTHKYLRIYFQVKSNNQVNGTDDKGGEAYV